MLIMLIYRGAYDAADADAAHVLNVATTYRLLLKAFKHQRSLPPLLPLRCVHEHHDHHHHHHI